MPQPGRDHRAHVGAHGERGDQEIPHQTPARRRPSNTLRREPHHRGVVRASRLHAERLLAQPHHAPLGVEPDVAGAGRADVAHREPRELEARGDQRRRIEVRDHVAVPDQHRPTTERAARVREPTRRAERAIPLDHHLDPEPQSRGDDLLRQVRGVGHDRARTRVPETRDGRGERGRVPDRQERLGHANAQHRDAGAEARGEHESGDGHGLLRGSIHTGLVKAIARRNPKRPTPSPTTSVSTITTSAVRLSTSGTGTSST